MMQTSRMSKFLGVNGVLNGNQRSRRWFALPGHWRMPRFELMRRADLAVPAEREVRGLARKYDRLSVGQGV